MGDSKKSARLRGFVVCPTKSGVLLRRITGGVCVANDAAATAVADAVPQGAGAVLATLSDDMPSQMASALKERDAVTDDGSPVDEDGSAAIVIDEDGSAAIVIDAAPLC